MANDLSSLEQRAMARFRARRGEAQPSPALGTALLGAMDSDPDAVASQRELARRSGLPLPSVVQHPD
ncbi:MAG: hypothetical protein KC616_23170, partial [Myxococcales bacterium]|nr:hypothetical protein [Myxococcales bacterium]